MKVTLVGQIPLIYYAHETSAYSKAIANGVASTEFREVAQEHAQQLRTYLLLSKASRWHFAITGQYPFEMKARYMSAL
jgi:hypothetical protein